MPLSTLFRTCWGLPLAILAVADNDTTTLQDLLETANPLLYMKNAEGFNAHEISDFLRCKTLLPPPTRTFRVLPKGEKQIRSMDQRTLEDFFALTFSNSLYFNNYKQLMQILHQRPYLLSRSLLGSELYRLGDNFRHYTKEELTIATSIRWIDDEIGYGLFTEEHLEKGTIIGELTGEERRIHRWRPEINSYCFHYPTCFWSRAYYVIDSKTIGNELRFINHSDTPNTEPQWVIDREMLHLLLYANSPIKKGTQLTYHYGSDYWKRRKKLQ